MTENTHSLNKLSVWPPRRKTRALNASSTEQREQVAENAEHMTMGLPVQPLSSTLPPPLLPPPRPASPELSSPLCDVLNQRKRKKQYRNGWEATPKPPAYVPFELDRNVRKRLKLTNSIGNDIPALSRREPLTADRWNVLAHEAGVINEHQHLRDFQIQCANAVISRLGDVVVVAPTGAGKSMVWMLPLLAVRDGISLVVTPYTSLGIECEQRANDAYAGSAIFVYAEQRSEEVITNVMEGQYRLIFVCPEMLESPMFAAVLHSKLVQCQLLAVYIDEAHLVHEAVGWRTSYGRLHKLRPIIGSTVPIVAISATLPSSYQRSLRSHAGLRDDYRLINLGNFRPELSTVVMRLKSGRSSFDCLAFVLPDTTRTDTLRKTIVYCDDVGMLTDMLWWFHARLSKLHLPTSLVEILHAGLSPSHESVVMKTFNAGEAKIFLATEKVGAGINFPAVEQVIVYLVQNDLTLAKFEQRKGRAGRTPGSQGIGILMVQPDLNLQKTSTVDPGILDLIQTKECFDLVIDRWLNNPPRASSLDGRLCCSNCHPSLQPSRALQWVMEDPASKSSQAIALTADEQACILGSLKTWRLRMWEQEWRDSFPGYAPEDLVSNEDLANVAKQALTINVVNDLRRHVRLTYWSKIAHSLLTALEDARHSVLGIDTAESIVVRSIDNGDLERKLSAEPEGNLEQSHANQTPSTSSMHFPIDIVANTVTANSTRKSQQIGCPPKPRLRTKASKFGEQVIRFS